LFYKLFENIVILKITILNLHEKILNFGLKMQILFKNYPEKSFLNFNNIYKKMTILLHDVYKCTSSTLRAHSVHGICRHHAQRLKTMFFEILNRIK